MWEIAVFVVSLLLTYAMTPHTDSNNGPATLTDFNVPTASPGSPIAVIFGTMLVQVPNVVWYGDMDYIPVYV